MPEFPRPLTSTERDVLDRLLAPDFPGVEELRIQAQTAVVIGTCPCGCPSYDVVVADDAPRGMVVNPIPSGGLSAEIVNPPDGVAVMSEVMLWARDGILGGTEIIAYGADTPTEWPDFTGWTFSGSPPPQLPPRPSRFTMWRLKRRWRRQERRIDRFKPQGPPTT